LLDRSNLGGVGHGDGGSGEGVTSSPVDSFVISVSAAYHAPSGTYIVTHGRGDLGGSTGGACAGDTFGDFFAVRVGATNPPTLTPAWCVPAGGYSSAIVTTLDGTAGPIVWRAGAASTSLLKAWDGETGAVLFDGGGTGDQLTYIRPYTSPIAVHGRIIAAGDNRVYAFSSQ